MRERARNKIYTNTSYLGVAAYCIGVNTKAFWCLFFQLKNLISDDKRINDMETTCKNHNEFNGANDYEVFNVAAGERDKRSSDRWLFIFS